jgi:6-pyruvoyltetrahydropterin/6-carboxytetrahydropterin synthase
MKIYIDGWKANLRFAAAHFIPDHDKCSRLHGHDYAIMVGVEGTIDDGIMADFGLIKKSIRGIIESLDHKLLLPSSKKYSKYEINEGYVHISYMDVKMVIPEQFVVFIDTNTSSSEELSGYLGKKLLTALKGQPNITEITLSVQEGPGQGAEWRGKF